jgi:hypothetical protein
MAEPGEINTQEIASLVTLCEQDTLALSSQSKIFQRSLNVLVFSAPIGITH